MFPSVLFQQQEKTRGNPTQKGSPLVFSFLFYFADIFCGLILDASVPPPSNVPRRGR